MWVAVRASVPARVTALCLRNGEVKLVHRTRKWRIISSSVMDEMSTWSQGFLRSPNKPVWCLWIIHGELWAFIAWHSCQKKMKDVDQYSNDFAFVFIKLIRFQILPSFFPESCVYHEHSSKATFFGASFRSWKAMITALPQTAVYPFLGWNTWKGFVSRGTNQWGAIKAMCAEFVCLGGSPQSLILSIQPF